MKWQYHLKLKLSTTESISKRCVFSSRWTQQYRNSIAQPPAAIQFEFHRCVCVFPCPKVILFLFIVSSSLGMFFSASLYTYARMYIFVRFSEFFFSAAFCPILRLVFISFLYSELSLRRCSYRHSSFSLFPQCTIDL